VRRDGLWIAVDHDGLEAAFGERECRVAAAIIKLDSLAYPIWSTAQDDDLLFVGWSRLAFGDVADGLLVRRVHVRRQRRELRCASVDTLEYGPHAELRAQIPNELLCRPGELGETRI